MALNFPSSPTINQTYSSGGKTWKWTGSVWAANADVFTSSVVAVPALNIDCSLGNYFTKTISSNSTFTFSNAPVSGAFAFTLRLSIGNISNISISWPSSVKWPGQGIQLAANSVNLLTFVTDNGGTTWRASVLPNYTS